MVEEEITTLGHPSKPLLERLMLVGGVAVLVFGGLFAALGMWGPACIEGIYALVIAISYTWLRLTRRGVIPWTWIHIFSILLVCGSVTVALGGYEGSAGFMTWGLIAPLGALIFLGRWATVLTVLLYGATAFAVPHCDVLPSQATPLAEPVRPWGAAANVIGSCILCLISLGYFLQRLAEAQRKHLLAREEALRAQKLESLGTLAGGIGHDFSNIITGLTGNLLLSRDLLPANHEVQSRLLRMEEAVEQATKLTRQLKTISRGHLPNREVVLLDRLVRKTVSFAIQETTTRAHLDVDEALWPVKGNHTQLSQVVHNLALNATQAMPDGGELRIQCSNRAPDSDRKIGLDRERPYVLLEVQDEGVGIPKPHLDRIFDPYFTTRAQGTGLGLATCESIVRSHEGKLLVRSDPGEGTTFSVYLPAAPM